MTNYALYNEIMAASRRASVVKPADLCLLASLIFLCTMVFVILPDPLLFAIVGSVFAFMLAVVLSSRLAWTVINRRLIRDNIQKENEKVEEAIIHVLTQNNAYTLNDVKSSKEYFLAQKKKSVPFSGKGLFGILSKVWSFAKPHCNGIQYLLSLEFSAGSIYLVLWFAKAIVSSGPDKPYDSIIRALNKIEEQLTNPKK